MGTATHDVIVIGAGPAGGVLAGRLASLLCMVPKPHLVSSFS